MTAVTVRVWLDSEGGPATSFESKTDASSASGVPSSVLAESAPATGGLFGGGTATVKLRLAVYTPPPVSRSVNVNVYAPFARSVKTAPDFESVFEAGTAAARHLLSE